MDIQFSYGIKLTIEKLSVTFIIHKNWTRIDFSAIGFKAKSQRKKIICIIQNTYIQGRGNSFYSGGARIIGKIRFWQFSKNLLHKSWILGGPGPSRPPQVPRPWIYISKNTAKKVKTHGWTQKCLLMLTYAYWCLVIFSYLDHSAFLY